MIQINRYWSDGELCRASLTLPSNTRIEFSGQTFAVYVGGEFCTIGMLPPNGRFEAFLIESAE